MCSISTRTDLTDHSINAHPRAALRHVPKQPTVRYDETGSAASSTNTCRPHKVTELLAPQDLQLFQLATNLAYSLRVNLASFVALGLRERPASSYLIHHRGTLNG
jgi:hypothetical protein